MKKIVLFGVMAAMAAILSAQNLPAFDNPKAVVCDLSAIAGKAKKDIRIINATHEKDLELAISVYDAKAGQWLSYGNGTLPAVSASVTVKSSLRGNLEKYSHVAVLPSVDKDFKVLCSKADNNVNIAILSQEEPSEYATVLDVFAMNGSFKGAVSLVNKTGADDSGFDIYAQKDESDTWFKVGTAYAKKNGDSCTVPVVTPDPVESYRYFSVIAHNGNDYAYDAKKEKNTLVLMAK